MTLPLGHSVAEWTGPGLVALASRHLREEFARLYPDAAEIARADAIQALALIPDVVVEWASTPPRGSCELGGVYDGDVEPARITIRESHNHKRNLFTALHEVGHHILWNDEAWQFQILPELRDKARLIEEKIVNDFAASILVPEEAVREFGMSKQTSAFALPHKMSEHFDFGARQLKTRSWRDTMLGRHKAVHDLSQAFGHLNHAHPFREGNGRSTRIFLRLELRRHGLDLDSSAVTSREWNEASALTEPKMGRYGIDVSADLMRGIFSKMLTKQQPVQALTEAQIQRVVDGFTIQPERSASRYDWPSIIEKYEDSPADWQPEL